MTTISILVALALSGAPGPTGLAGVVKGEKAAGLPAAARTALERDGSVRLSGEEAQFFNLYDRNAYEGVPSFVSLDVALHLVHIRLDALVADAERSQALPALESFAKGQAHCAAALLPKSGPPDERLSRLALFHAVPFAILGGRIASPAEKADAAALVLPVALAARANAAAKAITDARGALEPGLCGRPVDLSQFTPRGHYRGALAGYFQAFSFYSQCAFDLDSTDGLWRAVDLARLLDPDGSSSLRSLRAIADLVAGLPDDADLFALAPLIDASAPALPAPLSAEMLKSIAQRAQALSKGEVPSQASVGEPPVRALRLLGGAAEPDSLIFASVVQRTGTFPSVLHLLAALGSADARAVLGKSDEALTLPPPKSRSLFTRWLEVLQLAAKRPGQGHPPFELTDSWARHLTIAAAGSWAELRHDTLLYVKSPLIWLEGGHNDELPARAAGFVEPRPEVYRALQDLVGAIAQKGDGEGSRLVEFLKFLTDVSELELAGKPFPPAADEALRTIGSRMEALTRGHADALPPQELISDVLDLAGESGARRTLEVGIGCVDELWVVVPRGGQKLLTRGGAFAYYEFPSAERLTDESWLERLQASPAPARPGWAGPQGKAPPPRYDSSLRRERK